MHANYRDSFMNCLLFNITTRLLTKYTTHCIITVFSVFCDYLWTGYCWYLIFKYMYFIICLLSNLYTYSNSLNYYKSIYNYNYYTYYILLHSGSNKKYSYCTRHTNYLYKYIIQIHHNIIGINNTTYKTFYIPHIATHSTVSICNVCPHCHNWSIPNMPSLITHILYQRSQLFISNDN